jgi:hypothetical protein
MKKQSLLLDGQQKYIVALGHFNPFDNNSEKFFLKTWMFGWTCLQPKGQRLTLFA